MIATKGFKVHVIFLALISCTLSCVKNQKDTTDDVIIEGNLKYPIISESVSIEKISDGQIQGYFFGHELRNVPCMFPLEISQKWRNFPP